MMRTIGRSTRAGLSAFSNGLGSMRSRIIRRARSVIGQTISDGLRAAFGRVIIAVARSMPDVVRAASISAQSYAVAMGLARMVEIEAPGLVNAARLAAARNAALTRVLARIERRVGMVVEALGPLATKEEIARAVHAAAESHIWEVERVLRTEASIAYNTARRSTIMRMAARDPRVMMRWTELVDDRTGRPLDGRVAPDSLLMHGQVAPVGGLFVMPPGAKNAGQTWAHPPNRPNDRAVLVPWVPGSGIPAWRIVNGMRVDLN